MTKAKVGVLISGAGTNMAALLYAAKAADCPYELVLVASNNPEAPGLALAAAEGIAIWAQSHKGMSRAAFDALVDERLRAAGADYVALAGYMRILSDDFVAGWTDRMLNIHPSLLPLYKGLDTHQRAIDAGDRFGGCSVHVVTPALDDGPVLAQTPVAIVPGDTAETLAERVRFAEHQLYPAALAAFVASLGPGPAIPDESDYSIDGLDSAAQEAAIVRGGQLFLTNCTACHNFEGSGGAMPRGGYAPKIRGVEPKYIYEALLTGPQTMPTFSNGNLTPDEKRDVIAYLGSLDDAAAIGGFTMGGLGPVAEGLFAWVVGIGALVGFAVWIAAHTTRSNKKKVEA